LNIFKNSKPKFSDLLASGQFITFAELTPPRHFDLVQAVFELGMMELWMKEVVRRGRHKKQGSLVPFFHVAVQRDCPLKLGSADHDGGWPGRKDGPG